MISGKKITLGSYPNPDPVIIHLYRNALDFLKLFIFTDMSTSLPVDHETLIMLANNECDYLRGYWSLFFYQLIHYWKKNVIDTHIDLHSCMNHRQNQEKMGYLKEVCKILFPMQVESP